MEYNKLFVLVAKFKSSLNSEPYMTVNKHVDFYKYDILAIWQNEV